MATQNQSSGQASGQASGQTSQANQKLQSTKAMIDDSSTSADESRSGGSTDRTTEQSTERMSAQDADESGEGDLEASSTGSAIDVLRGTITGVLDSVVREYEPQIAQFTSDIAHQAVERGVEFAQNTVQRVKSQSWLRLGLAAALGLGAVAVIAYEVEQGTSETKTPRTRKNIH